MNRRGFLKSMLATGAASYVVTSAGVLMPVRKLLSATPEEVAFVQSGTGATARTLQEALRLWGDGIHDDTAALQAFLNGGRVVYRGREVKEVVDGGTFLVTRTIHVTEPTVRQVRNAVIDGGAMSGPGPVLHIHPTAFNEGRDWVPAVNYCYVTTGDQFTG